LRKGDMDLDLLSSPAPDQGQFLLVNTNKGRESNSNSVVKEKIQGNVKNSVEWKLTREDLKYNLMVTKLITWLNILPVQFDADSGSIWLPAKSCKWKGRVRSVWMGFVGTRLVSILISLIYTIVIKERDGEFQLYQQMLDTVVTFAVSLIFIGYCSVLVQNLPSQTILSNQIYEDVGKRKNSLYKFIETTPLNVWTTLYCILICKIHIKSLGFA